MLVVVFGIVTAGKFSTTSASDNNASDALVVENTKTNRIKTMISQRKALSGYLNLAEAIQIRLQTDSDIKFRDEIRETFRMIEKRIPNSIATIDALINTDDKDFNPADMNAVVDNVHGFSVTMVQTESVDGFPRLAMNIYDRYLTLLNILLLQLKSSEVDDDF